MICDEKENSMNCHVCHEPMIAQKIPNPLGLPVHWGRGLCRRDHQAAVKNGTIADYERNTRTADEVLDEALLVLEGMANPTRAALAERLGMGQPSLMMVLYRASNRGDQRAIRARRILA